MDSGNFQNYKLCFEGHLISAGCGLGFFFLINFFTGFMFFHYDGGVLFFMMIFIVPMVPFHLNYLIEDWGKKVSIDYTTKTITLEQNNFRSQFSFSSISHVEYCNSLSSLTLSPWCLYGYMKFYTEDSTYFVVTSLSGIKKRELEAFHIQDNYLNFPFLYKNGNKLSN